ncbi:MAG: HAMP domain-containing sensor histidine kinase [Pseudomonadota bacterium]
MEELLAMVCHELRSPIASMRYAVRAFLGSHAQEDTKQQQLQALIERQTRNMTRLIDDLLDIARMRNDSLRLHCERLDLRAIVAHAVETLASEIDTRGHQLTTVAPDHPLWVTGDPFRLEQVFVNLLANAAKYTGPGGRIAIRIHVRENLGVVRICDSGSGITPELLPHIFQLFRQAGETGSQSLAGLGIGLAIVRTLVEMHGGDVTANSPGAGQGSEFVVCLPMES